MGVRVGRRVGPESERQAGRGAGELNEGTSGQRGFVLHRVVGTEQNLGVAEF